MLGRAAALGVGEYAGQDPSVAPAAAQITVENFPGLCMGVTVLTSLSLHRINLAVLTQPEADALTAALLKNVQAWELDKYLENPRLAAGLDLAGVVVAIMVPRIIADAKRAPAPAPSAADAPAGSA